MFIDKFVEYCCAGYGGIWLQSYEQHAAMMKISEVAAKENWAVVEWDMVNGLIMPPSATAVLGNTKPQDLAEAPTRAMGFFADIAAELLNASTHTGKPVKRVLFVLHNLGKVANDSPRIQQFLLDLSSRGSREFFNVVMLVAGGEPPLLVNRSFVRLEHELPSKDDLWRAAQDIAAGNTGELPSEPEAISRLLESAAGMTSVEACNAYALSILRNKAFDPELIWDLKIDSLSKARGIEIVRGSADIGSIGGHAFLREYSRNLLRCHGDNATLRPKGLFFVGVPGSGKTQLIRCLPKETGRNLIILHMGLVRSKFQGETDENLQLALKVAEAMQPSMLFIDEVNTALSGANSGGETDGGAGDRLYGALLQWMQKHTADVAVMCACNDADSIPPAFHRDGRITARFFFDFPGEADRKDIWSIYLRKFGFDESRAEELTAKSNLWTGSKIEAACENARLLGWDLDYQMSLMPDEATKNADSIERMRDWADGYCLSTERPELYRKDKVSPKKLIQPKTLGRKLARTIE